jgi:hypothetical protein
VASYLGLVVVWYENGLVHKAILDFIRQDWFSVLLPKYSFICRLTSKHSGDYLAKVVAECLERFGLDKLVRAVLFVNYSSL